MDKVKPLYSCQTITPAEKIETISVLRRTVEVLSRISLPEELTHIQGKFERMITVIQDMQTSDPTHSSFSAPRIKTGKYDFYLRPR